MIAGIKIGRVFLLENESAENFKTLAFWPENSSEDKSNILHSLALKTLNAQEILSSKISYPIGKDLNVYDATGLPLRYGDKIIGAVVFLQNVHSQEHKKAVFPLLQWGCTWLESSLKAAQEEKSQLKPLISQLTQLVIQDEPLEFTAHQVCNLLAQQLNCERVSLGLLKGLQVHTLALSNQLRFDARSSDVRQMESAMEEALDQEESIIYPSLKEKENLITQKHQALCSNQQDMRIFTLVLSNGHESFASLVLVRKKNQNFSDEETYILKESAKLLGPAINLKFKNEHSFSTQIIQRFKQKSKSLFGAGNLSLKISFISLFLILSTLSLVQTSYYVYAKSTLEGALQQVIVASQDGYVKSSHARAGDRVEKEQLLLSLEDKELRLEREVLLSEEAKLNKEYNEELASGERAKISIALAKIAQVDAEIKLIQERLKHAQFKAPFSGIIVSGDLSQSIGKPIQKGEQLFEIALLGDYRVSLDVDEYDVSKLQNEQKGELRLVGLPYEIIPITITRITPIASAKEGGNYFHVEADLSDFNSTQLKPGMQGIAKVCVGEASILWVWTHSLMDRLRLWFWSIGL